MRRASYWIKCSQEHLASQPSLSGGTKTKFDVVVVGGGIFGVSTALGLQEEGKSVALLDMHEVGKGVTGYSTGKVTSLHRLIYADLTKKFSKETAGIYANLNEEGLRLVEKNVKHYNLECDYSNRDAFTYTCDEKTLSKIEEEVEAAQAIGLRAHFETETDLPFPVKGAIRLENQAQFNPYAYCRGLARYFIEKGGKIFENTRVVNVHGLLKAPHVVETIQAEIETDHVVLATHLPMLDRSGHFSVVSPQASYGLAYSLQEGHSAPKGMYITAEQESTRSIRSADNGKILIIGGNSHSFGERTKGSTETEYAELDEWTRQTFPVKKLLHRWSAEDYMPSDKLPYIGYLHHGCNSIYTATGFQKWGFTTGAIAAKLVQDLIAGRDHPGHSLFDARRWDVTHSTVDVLKFQAHVGKHFVKDRLENMMNPGKVEDLQPDTGNICKHKDKLMAVYRDQKGLLHAISPTCSHMGCHIVWNQAERVWDCPCHGSQFDVDGKVLHGPAVKDLETYQVKVPVGGVRTPL